MPAEGWRCHRKADPGWRLSRDPPSSLPAQPLPPVSDGQSKGRPQISGDLPLQHPRADVGPALHPGDLEQAEDTTRPLWLARLAPCRYRPSWDVGQLEGTGEPSRRDWRCGTGHEPCRGARNVDLFPPTSWGTGWRVQLCKHCLLHLMTFSLNKSCTVSVIINWGWRSSDKQLHCCAWRLFPFPAQTHSLFSLAAAGFSPWAGKCWERW